MALFLIIYIVGYIIAFIMLMHNEKSICINITKIDLITNAFMAVPSWLIVICELPTFIKKVNN